MANWHQQRNPAPLYHKTKWTVVRDPPNKCCGLSVFSSEQEAEEYLDKLTRLGKGRHVYILPPYLKEET